MGIFFLNDTHIVYHFVPSINMSILNDTANQHFLNPKSNKHCFWAPPDSGNTDLIMLILGQRHKSPFKRRGKRKRHFSPMRLSLMRSQVHVLLRCLFMGQVEEEDAGESTDQEDHVKPAVVEVKLQFSQYLRHYGAVL